VRFYELVYLNIVLLLICVNVFKLNIIVTHSNNVRRGLLSPSLDACRLTVAAYHATSTLLDATRKYFL